MSRPEGEPRPQKMYSYSEEVAKLIDLPSPQTPDKMLIAAWDSVLEYTEILTSLDAGGQDAATPTSVDIRRRLRSSHLEKRKKCRRICLRAARYMLEDIEPDDFL